MEDNGKLDGKWGNLIMNFVDKIRECEDYAEAGGVDEEQIKDAEEKLGIAFSDEFRLFLRQCGAACANGHEFLGICDSKRLSIVDATRKAKKENPQIEKDMYLIENIGIDKIRVWQNTKGNLFQTVGNGKPEMLNYGLTEYLDL